MSSSPTQHCRWHTFESAQALQIAAVSSILSAASEAIAKRGAFHLVLAGGSTPQKVYAALQNAETNWAKWHIYFGDERCLPTEHPERNSKMAALAWLNQVAIPSAQIHPIQAELGAQIAAEKYLQLIDLIEYFDMTLLGLGEDGHTASLFPNHEWGTSIHSSATLAVFDAPKPPAERVSLSANRLSQSKKVLFLVSGKGKQEAVERWKNQQSIPAASIAPLNGVDIYTDFV
jgi:6-phosphogluconolactonase